MEIVPDDGDEVLIEATPISSRSPTIIDYKIHKEGKKNYFKIIRADDNSQVYQTFEKMFKNFNREDVEVLWAIVKDRFRKEKPVNDMDNILGINKIPHSLYHSYKVSILVPLDLSKDTKPYTWLRSSRSILIGIHNSDDEEEYQIKINKFRAPIYGLKPAPYLNCNDPAERSLWGNDDEVESSRTKRFRQFKTVEEVLLLQVYHEFLLWEGCSRDTKSRLRLYQAVELDDEGFNVYFKGGLRRDEHFNAQEYWLSISREDNLGLSRSHTSSIKSLILRVIHKMITYGLCQRTSGYDKIQKNDLWLLSMFDARHQNGYANVAWLIARKSRVLTDDVIKSLSALIYCRDLDTTTLKDLIDSEGRLIPEDPQPGVPRVGVLKPPRAYMQDLYDKMGRMEIRQGAYNPPGYAQPQYDQYYQRYPPPPPQQQQQQHDDE
uniref:Uncharacterized protein n=1 Tax=Tanacetum cinerariifolium TaxID=118510 RepID=A0A6L2MT44_TANCI|nr:hypothetical protein [Tanacetum cinerariifolium]